VRADDLRALPRRGKQLQSLWHHCYRAFAVDAALRHLSTSAFTWPTAMVPRTGHRNRFRRSGTTRSRAYSMAPQPCRWSCM